jgi:hypothetical protein
MFFFCCSSYSNLSGLWASNPDPQRGPLVCTHFFFNPNTSSIPFFSIYSNTPRKHHFLPSHPIFPTRSAHITIFHRYDDQGNRIHAHGGGFLLDGSFSFVTFLYLSYLSPLFTSPFYISFTSLFTSLFYLSLLPLSFTSLFYLSLLPLSFTSLFYLSLLPLSFTSLFTALATSLYLFLTTLYLSLPLFISPYLSLSLISLLFIFYISFISLYFISLHPFSLYLFLSFLSLSLSLFLSCHSYTIEGKTYYWYGETNKTNDLSNHGVNCYSSADLVCKEEDVDVYVE